MSFCLWCIIICSGCALLDHIRGFYESSVEFFMVVVLPSLMTCPDMCNSLTNSFFGCSSRLVFGFPTKVLFGLLRFPSFVNCLPGGAPNRFIIAKALMVLSRTVC